MLSLRANGKLVTAFLDGESSGRFGAVARAHGARREVRKSS